MKQSFLLGLVLLSPSLLLAQEIPNGDFELWSIQVLFERPDDWDNGNYQDAPVVTTTKVTGAPEGQFAAHLETQILDDDTAFGYVLLGRIDETPVAGVPHGTDVAAVECWLRYDLQPGDTALALAVCWSGGTIVSSGEWRYQGQQTTWMQQTFTLPLAATNVDSVVVAFASTDPFTEGIAQQGSWVEVDDVHLTHPNVPTPDALPNAGFEDWSDVSAEDPDGWASYNARVAGFGFNSVSKSTERTRVRSRPCSPPSEHSEIPCRRCSPTACSTTRGRMRVFRTWPRPCSSRAPTSTSPRGWTRPSSGSPSCPVVSPSAMPSSRSLRRPPHGPHSA